MRPRHVLLACAAFPLVALHAPAAKALDGRQAGVASSDIAAATADVRRLIDQVDIPYDSFTLPNGLRVLVHQDRSTPVIHVSVSYDVGSKHEPTGRSGFAHLFEHLMFTGSENVPGDYVKRLMNVGGSVNGTTDVDRTNYHETVPTPALDRALFMESDRMGHLLGALDQKLLDAERGVVQNEKRDASADPTSVIEDKTRAALYPGRHPYGHSVIGSMRDLDAATLDDVRRWFQPAIVANLAKWSFLNQRRGNSSLGEDGEEELFNLPPNRLRSCPCARRAPARRAGLPAGAAAPA